MALIRAQAEEDLLRIIKTTPIIDHHAHPLLNSSSIAKYPLLSISTEAHGDAINDTCTSLAHIRAVKQLSAILGCEASWDAVKSAVEARQAGGYAQWVGRCLSGIQAVLVDDGLDGSAETEPYDFFDKFTRSPSKRIVRIEHVAAEIINEVCSPSQSADDTFKAVMKAFDAAITDSIGDEEVVGFKSVICYRTGLAIPRTMQIEPAIEAFRSLFEQSEASGFSKFTRVDHVGLNEYLVHRLATLIRDSQGPKKSIQFHTGLGDNDITLTKSSPAHLQDFIREYPTVPIVLLHASYPYTREAGYLATVYANVYADIGEVFPFVSRDGQEAVIRQILELCPSSKILWSTDGHWFPETYLLAVEQVREVLHTVLCDYVHKQDLTWAQAAEVVADIFFNNANELYYLGLNLEPLTTKDESAAVSKFGDLQLLTKFLENKEAPRFLQVYWNDMTAMPRMRAVPIRRVWSMLQSGEEFSFGVTKASLGLLQNDTTAPGVSPSGEYKLHPDLQTLRFGPRQGYINARGDFKESDGSAATLCPRATLKKTLEKAAQHGLAFILGFEIELLLVRRVNAYNNYESLDADGHAWSVARAMEHDGAAAVLEDAIEQLDEAGVYVEMVHPESANGQYEVVLPGAPALEAVDTLLYARDILSNCAAAKGFRMTLHPKPFTMAAGTAAHVHMSISTPNGSDQNVYEPFYAGILKHLPAIAAFTYSSLTSYERVVDGCWAGGTWVTWGTQNRETPLRKIKGSHWELKCMDGMANPYLALSAVLSAGVQGVTSKEPLAWADCNDDPAKLSQEERERLNVRTQLPGSIDEALEALQEDSELTELLGRELVERYVAVKEAETKMLEAMEAENRRQWVMARY
ncbi:Protein fluG [Neonectria ditissima]|uniref:Glutamine synthetase n=1 Tax=Neonectria ditissima TaxID=78410 RepID=A0A0P7BMV1_9HYPO|nr:Protein fluG [Neonectria ditissima]